MPSQRNKPPRKVSVSTKLYPDEKLAFEACCKRRDRTVSDILRTIIRGFMAETRGLTHDG